MFNRIFRTLRGYVSPREFLCPGGYIEIWKIAWPLIVVNASNVVMMLFNRAFLARIRTEDVTAAVAAGQLFFCVNCFFLITALFTGTLVAQHFGNKDRNSCIRSVWNGFYFAIAVTLLMVPLLPLFGQWIFQFGDLSQAIRDREIRYFAALSPLAGLSCMEAPFLSFFSATGRTKITAAIKIATCIVSVPLNYIMVYGKLGFPELGITGAGLAASSACGFSMVTSILIFLFQDQKNWPSRRFGKLDLSVIRKLLIFGAPGGLQACCRNISFALVLFFFGCLPGDTPLACASLAMTINNIGFFPLMGLMDATSVLTGKYIGARNIHAASHISSRAMRMLLVYFVPITVLYLCWPEVLIGWFAPAKSAGGIDYAEVLKMVRLILMIQLVQNIFDGIRFIVSGSLRGAGDTRIPLLLSLATSWLVSVPMAYLLTIVWPSPIWVAWGGAVAFYVVVDAIVIQIRKNTGVWKRIKVIDLEQDPKDAEA